MRIEINPAIWMITDNVSITKIPPITANDSSWFVRIAMVARVAPRVKLPVSPIKTLAGFVLYTKNPIIEPTRTKQKIPISW